MHLSKMIWALTHFDIAELVMELEDEFGTEIPDEEAEKINTIGDAVKFINSLEK